MGVHTCCVCGKSEEWNDSWCWYGSYKDLEDHPGKIKKYCSRKCVRKANPHLTSIKFEDEEDAQPQERRG